MTYYDNFMEYIKQTVNFKMSTLDPNLVKKFLYGMANTNSQSNTKVEAKEVDD